MASLTPPSPPNVEAYALNYGLYCEHYDMYMITLNKYNGVVSSSGSAPIRPLAPAEAWNRPGTDTARRNAPVYDKRVPDVMTEPEPIESESSLSTHVRNKAPQLLTTPLPKKSHYMAALADQAIHKGNNLSDAEMGAEIEKLSASLGSVHVTEPDGTPTLATVVHALSGIYTPEAISDLKGRGRLPRSMRSLVNLTEMSLRVQKTSKRLLLRVKDVRAFRS
jgi:hypothetical protein